MVSQVLFLALALTAAMQIEYVRDIEIHVNPGYELLPLPEGASYLGFIFAREKTPEAVEAVLRRAHGALKFELEESQTAICP